MDERYLYPEASNTSWTYFMIKRLIRSFFPRFGFNKWRDPMRPTQVLAKLCKDEGLDGPHYSTGRVRIDNKVFGASSQVLEESGMCNHFCY